MSIIHEIISDLTKGEGSLEPALLKPKVLAYNFDKTKLIAWVNSELNGFKAEQGNGIYAILKNEKTFADMIK
jgi:hypothetical protein